MSCMRLSALFAADHRAQGRCLDWRRVGGGYPPPKNYINGGPVLGGWTIFKMDQKMTLDRDFSEIDPYAGRFPPVVERALFFLLLAPWERIRPVSWPARSVA
jgi:hypothetical protein